MKFLTAASLFVAAVVSAVVCIPFMPAVSNSGQPFALEVRLSSMGHGNVQVYYDSGSGFSEAETSRRPIRTGPAYADYELSLPTGVFRQFRFDPIDGDAPVTIEEMKIVSRDGRTVRSIGLAALRPAHDIAAINARGGAIEVVPTRGSPDPQLLLSFQPALQLQSDWRMILEPGAWHIPVVFAILVLVLFVLDRAVGLRTACANRVRACAAHPRGLILGLAALAVVLSCYPVVFLGKSFVSPNLGTVLLYDQFPTLPGYTSSQTADEMGSDIGAIIWQHVPLSMVESRALHGGEFPVWNRYNSSGTPLLGQGQSMFGDPLHFLVIAADGAAWAWDLKYLMAKWLFAAGLALIVFHTCRASLPSHRAAGERRSDGTAPAPGQHGSEPSLADGALTAALIVAAVAPFIGFFIYRLNHPAFFSMCYAPWALYCWMRAAHAEDTRGTAAWAGGLIVANLALMNSGTAKEAYMLLLTMNFAGLCVLFTTGGSLVRRLQKFALLTWAGVLFVLITAPIWATFLHELHNAYTSYNAASAYQIQPSLLLGAFDEIFYRPLMPAGRTFSPSLNFALLLGVLYFAATLRSQFAHRTALTLAAVSLVPLSLAFGLIPADWIVRVPLLANVAHIDNTFSCALIILWTVLAGVGFATARQRLATREGRNDLIIVALLLAGLVFAWVAFRQVVHRPIFGPTFTVNPPGHPLPVAPFIWGYLLSLLLAAGVLLVAVRRAALRRALTPAAALLIGLCAVVLCWRHGQQSRAVGFEHYVFEPTSRAPLHAASAAITLLQARQAAEPARSFGLHGNFFPGWTAAYGLETIHGPDALMSPHYRELVGAMAGIQRIWDWRLYLEPKDVPLAQPYLDSLNVRYYLDLRSDQQLMQRSLRLVKAADLDVYESPTAWPRAFFTDRVATYDTLPELVSRLGSGDGRPFAAIQRSDLATNEILGGLSAREPGTTVVPASGYKLTENTTRFQVHASGPGAVVLLETDWPGDFRAYVNGQKTPVQRFNHAFKGVVIDAAGDYTIEFRCVPKGWYRNLALSGFGFALLVASGVFVTRKTRSQLPSP